MISGASHRFTFGCRSTIGRLNTVPNTLPRMPNYRLLTLRDVACAVEHSGLAELEWPDGVTTDDFQAWLFVTGPKDVDTADLAELFVRFLKRQDDARSLASLRSEAQQTSETLDSHNAQVCLLGEAVGQVRSEFGDDVMQLIASLAVSGDPIAHIRESGFSQHADLGAALDILRSPCAAFHESLWEFYRPGTCEITDFLAVRYLWCLDESLAGELEWDGRSDYQVVQVIALVRFVRDLTIRALLTEMLMGAVVDSSLLDTNVGSQRPRRSMSL